ncbi:MAG TPA: hypothetical protein VKA67_07780, partial [Verrucomicrobiae bacterium]|nr:hypothetical protein [Verrucomicrobiae bacterium]
LRQLSQLPVDKRSAAIDEIFRANFDQAAVESRWQAFQAQIAPVRRFANILFVYLFVLAPFLIWRLGFKQCWLELLIGLLLLTTTTGVLFWRVHKQFYSEAEDDRFTQTLVVMLSPPSTMRVHDILSRPLLEAFHPLAVAFVFCSKEAFQQFARNILLDNRNPCRPACPGNDTGWRETELFSRNALLRNVEEFLGRNGVDVEEICQPPVAADATCLSYCPRCNAQFTTTNGQCLDCGGVPLVTFKPPKG